MVLEVEKNGKPLRIMKEKRKRYMIYLDMKTKRNSTQYFFFSN